MLKVCNFPDLETLIKEIIPDNVKDPNPFVYNNQTIPEKLTESDLLEKVRNALKSNSLYKTYIGQGYYNTITPSVI